MSRTTVKMRHRHEQPVKDISAQRKSTDSSDLEKPENSKRSSILKLVICITGIYISFLMWAVLQERISTTPYGPDNRVFRSSLVINTVQSVFACLVGYIYLLYKRRESAAARSPVFPDLQTARQYLVVAASQSLSSPFAYASLKYVDYVTLLLAKSCKLLPVMALHLTVYRRKFPLYKYLVVATITMGVCFFTLYHPDLKKKGADSSSLMGLLLLGINLLLDGFYNTTQDHMFHTNPLITGPHMMCGLNVLSAVLTAGFLATGLTSQLADATEFIKLYPQVLIDIILFSTCGALGQVFIFQALESYGSLILVTVTVTRKMFSMLLSVIWFNHRLTTGQWVGVLAVFSGIGAEAYIKYSHGAHKKTT